MVRSAGSAGRVSDWHLRGVIGGWAARLASATHRGEMTNDQGNARIMNVGRVPHFAVAAMCVRRVHVEFAHIALRARCGTRRRGEAPGTGVSAVTDP